MKKLFTLAFALSSAIAGAAEVTVLDVNLPTTSSFYVTSDSRFQMDTKTGEGYVKVTATEERYIDHVTYDQWGRPYRSRIPMPTTIFSDMVKVPGLGLMGDKVVYQTENTGVECGHLGESRVFKVPTIYLNGNCKLSNRISGGMGSRLVVTLKTK